MEQLLQNQFSSHLPEISVVSTQCLVLQKSFVISFGQFAACLPQEIKVGSGYGRTLNSGSTDLKESLLFRSREGERESEEERERGRERSSCTADRGRSKEGKAVRSWLRWVA